MNVAVEVNPSSGSNPTDLELGKIQRGAEKPTAPDYDGDAGGTVVVLKPNSRKIKKRKSGEKDEQHAKAESIAGPSPDGTESINGSQKKPSSKKKKKKKKKSSSEAKFEDKKEDGSQGNQVLSKSPYQKSKRLSSNNEVKVKISSNGKLSEDIQAPAKSGTKKLNPTQESAQEGTTQNDDVSPGIRYVATRAPEGKRRVTKPTAKISSLAAASEPTLTSTLNRPAEDGTPKTRTERSSKQIPEDNDCAVDDNTAPSGVQELSSPFPKRKRKVERAANKVQTPRLDRKPKDKTIIDEEKLEKKFRDMGLGLESSDDNINEAEDENIEGTNQSRRAEEHHKRAIRHTRRAAARLEKVKNQKTSSSSKSIQLERDEEIGSSDSVHLETNANVTSNMPKVNQQEVHIPVATLVEPPSKISIWCKVGVGMCCFLVAICIIVGVTVSVSGTKDNINQISSALTTPPTAVPPKTSEPIPTPSPSPSLPESSEPSRSPSPAPSLSPSVTPIKYGEAYWIQNNQVDNRWLSGSRSSDSVSFSLSWPFTHDQWENRPNNFVFALNFRDEPSKTSTYIWQFRSEFGDGTWMTEQNNDPKSGFCVKYEDEVILQNHGGIHNKWLTGNRGDAGRWAHTNNFLDGNYNQYAGNGDTYKFYVRSTPTGSSDPKVGECVEVDDIVYLNIKSSSRLYWLSGSRSDPYDSQDTSTNYVWSIQHSEEDSQFEPSYQWIIRTTPGDGSRN